MFVSLQAIQENFSVICECAKGTHCAVETCKMTFPEAILKHVAEKLKLKYEQSLYIAPTSLPQQERLGAERKLICFNKSVDYCTADPDYNIIGTAGRQCTVHGKSASSSHHCNNLCCGRGEEEYTITFPQPCNCKFVWCCKVVCDTCYETEERHRCK